VVDIVSRTLSAKAGTAVEIEVPNWFPDFLDVMDKLVEELHGVHRTLLRIEARRVAESNERRLTKS